MTDSSEIHSLISEDSHSSLFNKYSSSEYQYMNCYNNGSYAGGIKWDTKDLASRWIVFSDSYLSINFNVAASSGGAYTDATQIALKNSILQLIGRQIVTTSSGVPIYNEGGSHVLNNLKVLVEKSFDFLNSVGPELMLTKSTSNALTSQEFVDATATVATATTPAVPLTDSGTLTQRQTGWNSGFRDGIQIFKNNTGLVNAGVFSFTANIPLRLLHSYWEALDWPIYNSAFNITMGSHISTDTSTQCFYVSGGAAAPTVTIGTVPRLYYKVVRFSTPIMKQISEKMMKGGITKRVYFKEAQLIQSPTHINDTTAQGVQITDIVLPSVIRPVRLWVLLYPTGSFNSATAVTTPSGQLTNFNVQISGENYFQNNLQAPYDLWRELKQQMPGGGESSYTGSILSYSDFLSQYRIHCIDLSRTKERLASVNQPVSIGITCSRAESSPQGMDFYYIIERELVATMNFDSNSFSVSVGVPS